MDLRFELEQPDDPAERTIDLALEDELRVTLAEPATTGYRWSLKADERDVQVIDRSTIADDDPSTFGAPSVVTFVLQAVRSGTFHLHFELVAPWEDDATEHHDLTVRAVGSTEATEAAS